MILYQGYCTGKQMDEKSTFRRVAHAKITVHRQTGTGEAAA